jgi:hypothetical protein
VAETRLQFPEWRDENSTTPYPFSERATLTNGVDTIPPGSFLDASLYPIGGAPGLFLYQVTLTFDTATLTIGCPANKKLATGSFNIVEPPDSFAFSDAYGRPAGVIVSDPSRLAGLATLGVGTHTFQQAQTEFAATVCLPTPQVGVRGVQLADGTVLTGDVWLVGDAGVVLRSDYVTVPSPDACGPPVSIAVVRVDVVGDPLFRRRLCQPESLFQTPQFLRKITFRDNEQEVVCYPNATGDIKMTVNNAMAPQPVLRIHPTASGNVIEVVGSSLQNIGGG